MVMIDLEETLVLFAKTEYQKELKNLNANELHNVVSRAVMAEISDRWSASRQKHRQQRCAYYFSAEFLVGRAVYNNLFCLNLSNEVSCILKKYGTNINLMEDIEDAALGNGGLGRLAACFLDSAATLNLPLDGYGIRYKFGLFKQSFENGFQKELLDDWTRYGDPWSVRKEDEKVKVVFGDETVIAVPYDIPIIGYATDNIGTLRLWQAEAVNDFDFELFNEQKFDKSLKRKNSAENISRVLYPNDSTNAGKLLRLKQQYFFSSASLQDILRKFKAVHGNDFGKLSEYVTIQLNDTHPVISIPELIRLLELEGVEFDEALETACEVFNYTNHTIMQEALEKWDMKFVRKISPDVASIIVQIDRKFKKELTATGFSDELRPQVEIIQHGTLHMAYLACYCSKYINGVAQIHTEILKDNVLKCWYDRMPKKFQNKTNGITQRRWLGLCNPELSALITELSGNSNWLTNLDELKNLEHYAGDKAVLDRFIAIKQDNKKVLADYIASHDGIKVDPETVFDVQIKRLHEYKRQFLNALTIMELYFEIKNGELKDFKPTTFIFGAKSAPGYFRAKAIIKLIDEVRKLIEKDPLVSRYIKVVFVSNYNVSYAEKIVAAADVSEQISTASTEASGTGNMKLMLNGACTLGTYDGANIEIVKEAGEQNNFIFGARVEQINEIKETYNPRDWYNADKRIRRVLDALIDGTLDDDGTGMFRELYDSILNGASWHRPDHYFLLLDFDSYLKAKIAINNSQKDKYAYAKKCFINMCNAGKFSSDRTIKEYADEIWHIEKIPSSL
ncbi:MAG: glycogen/starch/alpha-glucan phosphorylase [Alphaproteobacteria bacterium]|nr:glycogen/starch/alpha-glucan phosphorylase [Alphaproteobacteria bacterium]MBR0542166.1 glycogen/starch/alpha-glucan phosphorylase [Clostridia bacterium]MBR1762315.1 glycogen/starch/alpha-glucan phosphorylase [Eubacterium sp.]MBR6301891.1 glycogen/starch/alpha-glucan phosphorylase [bacterium]